MTIGTGHPLLALAEAAAHGRFPPADGRVEVVAPPSGRCDAVIAFTGHAVVAGDVAQGWVNQYVANARSAEHEHHPILAPHFLAALAGQLGTPPSGISMLLAATPAAGPVPGRLAYGGVEPAGWADCRTDVRNFRYESQNGAGSISIGRGPAGRWDVWIGLDDYEHRTLSSVRGRELLLAAKTLAAEGAPLFASVPMHSVRSIRMALAAGFRPLAAEVLFCTRPG